MQVRGSAAGGLCAMLMTLGVALPAAESLTAGSTAADVPAAPVRMVTSSGADLLLVRHAGTAPVTLDTAALRGPALRAWWVDAVGDRTVDAGTVQRGPAVTLHPPDTGAGGAHDWTLVVVDATRGLAPPL